MLRELKHPNIVSLLDVIMEDEKLYLVFEFCSQDLKKYIDSYKNSMIDRETVRSFSYQIFLAIAFCHQRRVMHRDLKPQNILLDKENKIIKIGDFGLARSHGVPIRVYTHEVVTLW
ncbi:unnamed protein product [Cyprideis torosa]|uniref:Uncharacterized protein n=1 Tax=Cyprideis torosa TaxID=163714 RepID=A0A7R8X1K3_9CRUS|nr:unnamed protein product [Cyprideis torosa]CAG0911356.1 unnamed protein product [Cyprideis torosa]